MRCPIVVFLNIDKFVVSSGNFAEPLFKQNLMKTLVHVFTGILLVFFSSSYGQERKDELREKYTYKLESRSGKLAEATGWSRIQTAAGKVWEKSNPSVGYNYLVGCPREYSFLSLRMIEFLVNNKKYYTLGVQKPRFKPYEDFKYTRWEYDSLSVSGKSLDWFFFSEAGLKRLKEVVNAADGKTYAIISVKYFKTNSESKVEDYEEIYISDKELKNIVLTGNVTALKWTNVCKGDSLFMVNSQVLKGDTIVRFNVLSDISKGSPPDFKLLSLQDSYFEVSRQDFSRLFVFSPFVPKEASVKAKGYVSSGTAKNKAKDYAGAIAEYSRAIEIDTEYAEAYYLRALAKYATGEKDGGCSDLAKAALLGNKNAAGKMKELCP